MSTNAYILSLLLVLATAMGCQGKIAGGKADGAKIYADACARCHGDKGVPSKRMVRDLRVKDLTDPKLQKRLTDGQIRHQIAKGSSNRLMPAFGDQLSEKQLDAIVKFVRQLGANK